MASSVVLSRVALVRTDVSKEFSASNIRVTRIGEVGTTTILQAASSAAFLGTLAFEESAVSLIKYKTGNLAHILN
jgi:hypothetical protein